MTNESDQVNKKIYNYIALHKKIRELSENPTQFSILMLVSNFINSERHFFMNYETIAKDVKVSRKSIQREIAKLLDLELIFIIKKSTQHSPYVFRLSDVFFQVFNNQQTPSDKSVCLPDRTNWTSRQDNLSVQTGQIGPLNELKELSINVCEYARAREGNTHTILDTIKPEIQTAKQPVLKERYTSEEVNLTLRIQNITLENDKLAHFFPNSHVRCGIPFSDIEKVVNDYESKKRFFNSSIRNIEVFKKTILSGLDSISNPNKVNEPILQKKFVEEPILASIGTSESNTKEVPGWLQEMARGIKK